MIQDQIPFKGLNVQFLDPMLAHTESEDFNLLWSWLEITCVVKLTGRETLFEQGVVFYNLSRKI